MNLKHLDFKESMKLSTETLVDMYDYWMKAANIGADEYDLKRCSRIAEEYRFVLSRKLALEIKQNKGENNEENNE